MDRALLEHHLFSPQGRGRLPRGGADGVAGGAGCGDVARVGVTVEGDRVAAAGFEVSGCATMTAAGSATVALARERPVLEVARTGAGDIAAELGGLSPGKLHAAELCADALHRALGAAVATAGAFARRPGRVLVAMSGGVDSAVAALRCAQAGAEVVAVTLELWRDADNDPERSCCSAGAVRAARALAQRRGCRI